MQEQNQIEALESLTAKQREMLRLVYQHMRSKQIARVMGVSPYTVDEYLRLALRKLGVATRVDAARLLAEHELAQKAPQTSLYQSPGVVFPPADGSSEASEESGNGEDRIHQPGRQSGLAGDELEPAGDRAFGPGGYAGPGGHGSTSGGRPAPPSAFLDAWRGFAGSRRDHPRRDGSTGRGEAYVVLALTRLSLILGAAMLLALLAAGAFAAVVGLVTALQDHIRPGS
jgi:DNA-binding CsgD family transcriptional regulator